MLNGALAGVRTILWAVVVIAVPLYVVALILRETIGRNPDPLTGSFFFANVPMAFFMIFRTVVGSDDSDDTGRSVFLRIAMHHGFIYGLLYCITMMLMIFGLFNVIVAIFVDTVLSAAKYNDQVKMQHRLRDQRFFANKMAELTELIWETCPEAAQGSEMPDRPFNNKAEQILARAMSMEISQSEFENLRQIKAFNEILCDLDVSDEDQLYLFDTLDADGSGTIDLGELLDGIAKLRGDARRSDIVALSMKVSSIQVELKSHFEATVSSIQRQESLMHSVRRTMLSRRDSVSAMSIATDAFPKRDTSRHNSVSDINISM